MYKTPFSSSTKLMRPVEESVITRGTDLNWLACTGRGRKDSSLDRVEDGKFTGRLNSIKPHAGRDRLSLCDASINPRDFAGRNVKAADRGRSLICCWIDPIDKATCRGNLSRTIRRRNNIRSTTVCTDLKYLLRPNALSDAIQPCQKESVLAIGSDIKDGAQLRVNGKGCDCNIALSKDRIGLLPRGSVMAA